MVRSALILALFVSAAPAAALPQGFKAKADSLLAEAYAANGPGAAVIVTENGKTVYAAGRGLADIERKTPIGPSTIFRMGSITKQFTAAAVLRLAEQGKLSLDDPLSKFLPAYPAPGTTATVRQLLNHTSGVMPYTNIPGWMVEAKTGKAYSTEQLIAEFKDLPAPSKPGEKWSYNNSGYVLLGAVLEKVTGKPWDQAVADLVTTPLKLASIRSGIGADGTPGMATGYTAGDKAPKIAQKIHMSVPHGAGALVGTVGDLAAWGNALHSGKLLAPASYAAMTTATKTADGTTTPYGFGMQLADLRGRAAIGHGGGIFGFSTDSIYLPKEKIFVAVFANSDSPQSDPEILTMRLAALAAGDPFLDFTKVAVDPKAVDGVVGTYAFADTERAFFRRDGKLFAQRKDRPELEVFPAGGNKFFYGPDNLTWFEIISDAAGKLQFAMHQNGASKAEMGAWKGPPPVAMPAVVVPAAILDSYAGTYASPAGEFVFTHEAGGLTIKLGPQPTLPMKAISTTEFEITQVGAKIRFNAKDGKVGSITLFQGGQELEGMRSN